MSSLAKTKGAKAVEDPFTSSSPSQAQRHRYSGFNDQQFSAYSTGSPSSVTRTLEAYLQETERQLQEASSAGSTLLTQRQAIFDRMKEIQEQPTQDDISPELRQKLATLEREVSEVTREVARISFPKSRTVSGETNDDPTFLSSHTQHSPSKVHAPS
jgi:predicted transcriptional regulator